MVSVRLLPATGGVRDRVARRSRPRRPRDLFGAGDAVQFALVALLDADLADVLRTLVVGGEVALLQPVTVLFADAADVPAEHMRRHLAHRILAEQARP